jgi:hypothetical protein
MRLDELASNAGRAAADIGTQAERPAFASILDRSRRRAFVGGWFVAAVVIVAFFGSVVFSSRPGSVTPAGVPPATTTGLPSSTTTSTASTTTTLGKEPAQPIIGDVREDCPITFPDGAPFTPPEFRGLTLSFDGVVWYGTPELWTFVQEEGQVWEGLPVNADGSLTQKTFWWTDEYLSSIEPVTDITFTVEHVGGPALTVGPEQVTSGGHPEMGVFIIAGFEIPQDGCWRIAAQYRDVTVSYVAWAEGRYKSSKGSSGPS